MTAKEQMKEEKKRWGKEKKTMGTLEAWKEWSNFEESGIIKGGVELAQVSIHFLLSGILAGGVLFGDVSPFGVAMVGASGPGLSGAAALLGAIFGYLSIHRFSQGLRYVSASILTFSLWFCFYDLRILRKPWVMACITGVINGCTSYVYLSHGGWTPTEGIFYLAEWVVTIVATWATTVTLLPLRMEGKRLKLEQLPPRIAGTLFGTCLLISLSGIILWTDVSLGRIVGLVILLAFSWYHGSGVGAILGVSFGLALDLAQFDQPMYAMTWGFSAMASGFLKGKSRFHCGLAFLLANGVTVLWSLGDVTSFGIVYEVLLGAFFFRVVPIQWISWCNLPSGTMEEMKEDKVEVERIDGAKKQLEDSAAVFRLLGETLKTAFRSPENHQDVAVIFHRTSQKVCQKCYLKAQCWEQDYVSTCNAMNDATQRFLAHGKALPEDFPPYFAHRCLHFPKYLEELNLQITGFKYRKQYNSRVRESRVAVCEQYHQLARLLEHASLQISEEITPQVKKAKKLRDYLKYIGLDTKVELHETPQGLLVGEITGEGIEILEDAKGKEELQQVLDAPLVFKRRENTLLLKELEPFMVLSGFASSRKQGEKVCGDQSVTFKRKDGTLFVVVCDGMGSGEMARGESGLALELLQQFLRVGVETLQALRILSSALALRGEEQGGFTTVDLLEIDLMTGKSMLYKYGAAPTYLKRGRELKRLVGSSLPAGADFGQQSLPDQIEIELEEGDCFLLVSDGVSSGEETDGWLCGMLQDFSGDGVRRFAQKVMDETPEGGKDDRTAVMVKLKKRVWESVEEAVVSP